ncbi:hypothetical protein [Streptomyces sp. NPDC058155]|uniref:hypothetical protein n=1 Tax=Streptomyces sp. NPDC058155 TaxID=3346359 RepID=UPI0036EBE81E
MTDQAPAPTAVDHLRTIVLRTLDGADARALLTDVIRELTGRTVVYADQDLKPRRFVLRRRTDVTGVSGEGDVADGVLWPDQTANIRWRSDHPSAVFWDRGRVSTEAIHGHDGRTTIEWLDDEDGAPISEPDREQPLALRRAIDRALTASPPCPSCARTIACPCDVPRHEGRVEALLAAVAPWVRSPIEDSPHE